MAVPTSAKINLEWDNGRNVEIGTVDAKSEEKGTRLTAKVRIYRIRFGWQFVRLGFKLMWPRRKWETKYE